VNYIKDRQTTHGSTQIGFADRLALSLAAIVWDSSWIVSETSVGGRDPWGRSRRSGAQLPFLEVGLQICLITPNDSGGRSVSPGPVRNGFHQILLHLSRYGAASNESNSRADTVLFEVAAALAGATGLRPRPSEWRSVANFAMMLF